MRTVIQGTTATLLLALLLPLQASAFSLNDPKIAEDEIESLRQSALSSDEFEAQTVEYNIRMDELEAENPDRFYDLRAKPGIATLVVDICKSCRPQVLRMILKQKTIFTAKISMSDSKLNQAKEYRFKPGYMGERIQSYSASQRAGVPVYISMATQVNAGEYLFAASKEVQAQRLGQSKHGSGIHVDRNKIAILFHLIKKFHSSTLIKVR